MIYLLTVSAALLIMAVSSLLYGMLVYEREQSDFDRRKNNVP